VLILATSSLLQYPPPITDEANFLPNQNWIIAFAIGRPCHDACVLPPIEHTVLIKSSFLSLMYKGIGPANKEPWKDPFATFYSNNFNNWMLFCSSSWIHNNPIWNLGCFSSRMNSVAQRVLRHLSWHE
jgi:hypothetical protein